MPSQPGYLADSDMYLLRNLSRGKGVGYFKASGFHHDFTLRIVQAGSQSIAFVDPKGLRNISPTHPKVQFYKTIKDVEARLADPAVHLNSYLISVSSSDEMSELWGVDKSEMTNKSILFQNEDSDAHVATLLRDVQASIVGQIK